MIWGTPWYTYSMKPQNEECHFVVFGKSQRQSLVNEGNTTLDYDDKPH